MFKTILVPVDLAEPETAQPAIARAATLAEGSGGTIRLVNVRSLLPVTYMEFVPPQFEEGQQEEAEARLAEIAAGVPLPSERVSAVVRMGSVYNEVLEEADKTGVALLLTTHKERAELYQEQFTSKGLTVTIEPAE